MWYFLTQSDVYAFSLTWILIALVIGTGVGVAQYENYQEQVPGSDAILPMVYIEAGTFKMGSPKSEKGHFGDEGPQHTASIDGFWMGQFEITWDLYNLFVSREIDENQVIKTTSSEVQVNVDISLGIALATIHIMVDGVDVTFFRKITNGSCAIIAGIHVTYSGFSDVEESNIALSKNIRLSSR